MATGGKLGEFVAGVLVTLLLASGSYFVIERPFLNLKRRIEHDRAVTKHTGNRVTEAAGVALPASASMSV